MSSECPCTWKIYRGICWPVDRDMNGSPQKLKCASTAPSDPISRKYGTRLDCSKTTRADRLLRSFFLVMLKMPQWDSARTETGERARIQRNAEGLASRRGLGSRPAHGTPRSSYGCGFLSCLQERRQRIDCAPKRGIFERCVENLLQEPPICLGKRPGRLAVGHRHHRERATTVRLAPS